MVPRICLRDLLNRAREKVGGSYLIDIEELFKFELPGMSADEVGQRTIKGCLTAAIGEFEDTAPLFIDQSIYITGDRYEFIDNFEQYLLGKLPERLINLIPSSVLCLHEEGTYPVMGDRSFMYDADTCTLIGIDYVRTRVLAYCSCRRPVIYGETFDDSYMYYINPSGSLCSKLDDYVEEHILRRIADLSRSLSIRESPIDFLGSVEERYQDLVSINRDWAQSYITRGKCIV